MKKTASKILALVLSFYAFSIEVNATADECEALFRSYPMEAVSQEVTVREDIDTGLFRREVGLASDNGVYSNDGIYYVANRVSERFARLASNENFIGQKDPSLWDRELVVPNGGLCSSTCGVNILHTLFDFVGVSTSEFKSRSDLQIKRMIDAVKSEFNHDGRLGLTLNQLSFALKSVVKIITGDSSNLGTEVWSIDTDGFFNALHRRDENVLQIASVTTSENSFHAIVIIGMNESKKRISYADPHYPNEIITTDYEEVIYKGSPTIRIRWVRKYAKQVGYVKRLLNVWSRGIRANYVRN